MEESIAYVKSETDSGRLIHLRHVIELRIKDLQQLEREQFVAKCAKVEEELARPLAESADLNKLENIPHDA